VTNLLLRSPQGVWIWLGVYTALWTIVPALSNISLPLDTLEVLAWAREWPMGVYRHPPVKLWLMEVFFQASGGHTWSAYFLSAFAFCFGQYFIYRAICDVADRSYALMAILLTPLIFYFTVHLPQWNANVAQYPFCGLLLFAFWRALERGGAAWWLLIGIAATGGLLSKYSFGTIIVSLAVVAISLPQLRRRLSWPGIGLAALVGFVLLLPHLFWLVDNLAIVERYVMGRIQSVTSPWFHLIGPLAVVGLAIGLAILPGVYAVFAPVAPVAEADDPAVKRLAWLLGAASIGPFVIGMIIAGAEGTVLKDQWFMANFFFLPAFLQLVLQKSRRDQMQWHWYSDWVFVAIMIVSLAGYPGARIANYLGWKDATFWYMTMPMQPLAERGLSLWRQAMRDHGITGHEAPEIVIGAIEAAGVTPFLPGRPHWMENGNSALSPWVNQAMLADHGALVVQWAGRKLVHTPLCVGATVPFAWLDTAGVERSKLQLTVLLPATSCP
jgi:4-amino-4-deoxy-L-arabinose transferase-like glycosyltransferase